SAVGIVAGLFKSAGTSLLSASRTGANSSTRTVNSRSSPNGTESLARDLSKLKEPRDTPFPLAPPFQFWLTLRLKASPVAWAEFEYVVPWASNPPLEVHSV